LLLSRVVLGVGTAAVYTEVTVLIYELYEEQAMERALGYRSSANSAGATVWPLVGGAAGTLTWNLPFGVYLVALPLGLLAAATVPETRPTDGTTRPTDDGSTDGVGTRVAATLAVFRDRPALPLVCLLYFGANALLYVVVVFYPQFLPGVGVGSSFASSLYLAANGAAGGVAAAAYDRLVRRAGRSVLVAAALCLWVIGFGIATTVETAVGAVLPVVLLGLGIGVVFPSTFAWVESFAPRTGKDSSARTSPRSVTLDSSSRRWCSGPCSRSPASAGCSGRLLPSPASASSVSDSGRGGSGEATERSGSTDRNPG
jgi:MFS family permease